MNYFQHVSYLHDRVPRVRCDACGVHHVHVPWPRPGSGFTLLFEAMMLSLIAHMPVSDVAKIVSEHGTLIRRILKHYVSEACASGSMEEMCSVGIDEMASARGLRYVSVFVDMASTRVLFATPGKDRSTVEAFASDRTTHGGAIERITNVCSDKSPAFIAGGRRSLTYADNTYDRFHFLQLASVAVDTIRREEQ
jgi:transposase